MAVLIGSYLGIYFCCSKDNYLYFAKTNLSVNFGYTMDIADLNLKTNLDKSKIVLSSSGASIKGNEITFDKAGLIKINARSKELNAVLQVNVNFNNIDKYFNIFADINGSKTYLDADSIIDLYLPSCEETLAQSEGYINHINIGVDCLKEIDTFTLKSSGGLCIQGSCISAKSFGLHKVHLEFKNFGKSFEFAINVKEIAAANMVTKFYNDTMYVSKGEYFGIDVQVLPVYATFKNPSYTIVGQSVIKNINKFYALDYGSSYITYSIGGINKIINVVVCLPIEEMDVSVITLFGYNQIGKAVVNFYAEGELADGSFYIECYKNDDLIDNSEMLADFAIKHNIFEAKVMTNEKFVIRVICEQNIKLSFDISVNN